VSIVTRL